MPIFQIYHLIYIMAICSAAKITYISVEHPAVTYYNTKFLAYANSTARRYGRSNPVYYYSLSLGTRVTFANNVTVDFYFYEWLSNRYKRGFVEMHFGFCDLVLKDKFFGAPMKQGKLDRPCPFPPDDYHLVNMTIPTAAIPRGFPFTKGRIYANLSQTHTRELIGSGYADIELKQMKVKPT